MSISSEAKKEVESLLLSGKKIEAIRYISETFQVSLADAKKLVEVVEGELRSDSPQQIQRSVPDETSLDAEISDLVKSGKKLEAIKRVRESRRMTLREALTRVEQLHQTANPGAAPIFSTSGCGALVFKMAAVLFAFIGIALLIVTGFLFYIQQQTVANGVRIEGSVVDLIPDSDNVSFAPLIAYTWKGEDKQYQGTIYSNPPDFSIGETVALYVDPDNPDQITVDSFVDKWLVVIILGVFGGLFLLFSFFMGTAGRRSSRTVAG